MSTLYFSGIPFCTKSTRSCVLYMDTPLDRRERGREEGREGGRERREKGGGDSESVNRSRPRNHLIVSLHGLPAVLREIHVPHSLLHFFLRLPAGGEGTRVQQTEGLLQREARVHW